jgi:hypothetical protein
MSPWSGRSHAELAELVRELLLAGHLIDRAGMPAVISRLGREAMGDVAIGEWMAASPVYTRRMQRLLGFAGDTVETIFKGMQLDVGAPPEFMDFRLSVEDDHHGRFHLDHCGALMDVEPMGDDYVHTMCHTIEDPTFDATAAATNPRARMRPVHRPPRAPADRHPHCAWTVVIDPDADPLPTPPGAEVLARSRAGQLPLAAPDPSLPTDDGWNDYRAPLDPDLVMERFSSAALSAIADEVALQCQLLARAYLVEVAERVGAEEVVPIGVNQAAGISGLTAKRLAAALGVRDDLAGLAAVLAVHPLLLPAAYADRTIAASSDGIRIDLHPCPALDEGDGLSWPAILAGPGGDAVLHAAVVCVVPTARVERIGPRPGAAVSWVVSDDPDGEPATQPDAVTLTEFSTGATFAFTRRS